MNNIKYIKESKTFIIDGKIVKESELTPKKIREFKELAANWNLILGTEKIQGTLL